MLRSSVACCRAVGSLGSIVVLATCLSACSGAASPLSPVVAKSTASPVSPIAQAAVTASGTMTIMIPPKRTVSSATRRTAYVSPGTTHAAVFINGSTSPAGSASCTPSGSPLSCTVTWQFSGAVPASYPIAVEIDNGTTVLAENKATYVITAGSNTLSTLTLNGVAASASQSGETCTGASCSGSISLADAAGNAITNLTAPLASGFDNGPLTLASTAVSTGSVSAGGTITQPSASGAYAYTVACSTSTGNFQATVTPSVTTGSGDITSAELASLSLAYPASVTYASHSYGCSAASPKNEQSLSAWYDASNSGSITMGLAVSQWNDLSGDGYNLAQSTAGNMPTYITNCTNSLACISFSGTTYLNVGSFLSGDRTILTVVSTTATTGSSNSQWYNGAALLDADIPGGANDWGTAFVGGYPAIGIGNPDRTLRGSAQENNGAFYLNDFYWSSSTGAAGVVENGGTPRTGSLPTGTRTGASTYHVGYGTTSAGSLKGNIAELIVYSVVLTTTQRQFIEGYLACKWGLQGNLPSGHPYQSTCPIEISVL